MTRYDTIGRGYRKHRVPDPRIGCQIQEALGNARSVCNVGAGTGAYEPEARSVVAVEPSTTMIAQRLPGLVARASADALPFGDDAFDASMASLTIHHWPEVEAGLREMCRVAPRRVVFVFDPSCLDDFWLVRDYLPVIKRFDLERSPSVEAVAEAVGADRVEPVRVPWDCSDGFLAAYWRRPELYLDADVRACISGLALLPPADVDAAMRRLADDLESGAWARHNAELMEREEMDYGYRLIVSEEQ